MRHQVARCANGTGVHLHPTLRSHWEVAGGDSRTKQDAQDLKSSGVFRLSETSTELSTDSLKAAPTSTDHCFCNH
eukprot:6115411-Amphidinium_carterae.1